jgi:hypothetical protein
MGDLTSSYATAGIALRVSGALKPHHHDKEETPWEGQETRIENNDFGLRNFFNSCVYLMGLILIGIGTSGELL